MLVATRIVLISFISMPSVEAKTLSRVLKYLTAEGIVEREVLTSNPVGVRYTLTDEGRELEP